MLSLVAATVLPKTVINRILGRTHLEWESLTLSQFEESVIIRQIQNRSYVERYKNIAIENMDSTGIPASITLAQGVLESASGTSRIARESNNHFGIKCSRKCEGCTCRNYPSDTKYDMFRVFESVEECYYAHSKLLNGPIYRHLKEEGKDYKAWAYGLKKAGYAGDPLYAEKLIMLIEKMGLNRYDQ